MRSQSQPKPFLDDLIDFNHAIKKHYDIKLNSPIITIPLLASLIDFVVFKKLVQWINDYQKYNINKNTYAHAISDICDGCLFKLYTMSDISNTTTIGEIDEWIKSTNKDITSDELSERKDYIDYIDNMCQTLTCLRIHNKITSLINRFDLVHKYQ